MLGQRPHAQGLPAARRCCALTRWMVAVALQEKRSTMSARQKSVRPRGVGLKNGELSDGELLRRQKRNQRRYEGPAETRRGMPLRPFERAGQSASHTRKDFT